MAAMTANNADPGVKTVRVLVSFYLTTESGKTSGQPIHKEKFNVPISTENHTELYIFKRHLPDFTGLVDIALSKGLGRSLNISIVRVHKAVGGDIETFSVYKSVRPARLPSVCFSFFYNLALTSISFIDRPLSYIGRVFVDFFEQWLLLC